MQGEVGFTDHEVVEDLVVNRIDPPAVMDDRLVIAKTFLPLNLGDKAGFPRPDMVAAGAMRGDANLRGGVAAEDRTLLHETGFKPATRRGKGRADACKAAAGDDEIEGLFNMPCHDCESRGGRVTGYLLNSMRRGTLRMPGGGLPGDR